MKKTTTMMWTVFAAAMAGTAGTMVGDKGDNLWTPDPNGPHARMTFKWPRERVAALIDDLMAAPPAK